MTCRETDWRLLLYAADELPPGDRERVHRHLSGCAACRAALAELRAAEAGVRAAFEEAPPVPESLDHRVMRSVRALAGPRRAPFAWGLPFPLRFAFGLGAVLLAAVVWGLLGGVSPRARVVALTALRAEHERPSDPAAEVDAGSRAALEARLSRRVRFPVLAVDLSPEQVRLVAGEDVRVQGSAVACLRYQWKGERVSLFQMDARRLSPPGLGEFAPPLESYVAQRSGGISYVAWRSRGVHYVLVSRAMPMHRLFQLACHACERQERQQAGQPRT